MSQKILRKADVYFKDDLAGYLSETNEGYIFQYDEDFLKKNTTRLQVIQRNQFTKGR